MLYGGEPLKPVPPSKNCIPQNTQTMGLRGPGPYSYGLIAKQPGSDYKIRIRDMERMRLERYKIETENMFKSISRHAQHIEMIDVADKKSFYKRVKRMVDDEMKANDHLFAEKCPKQELVEVYENKPEHPKISTEEMEEILNQSKIKRDEEKRKIAEEKRLQQFIENSSELRVAAIDKRKKEIAELNYKIIQENEMMAKEQKIKKREQANMENTQLIQNQIHVKEEERRNILEQKRQFRNELHKQFLEKEIVREQEKELKNIERNDFIKLKKQLNEKEASEKLERIKNWEKNKEEIGRFIEERIKIFKKLNEMKSIINDTFITTVREHFTRDTTDHREAKVRLRHENEMHMKHEAIIKEERRKQNEEMSNVLMKQIKEIEELKLSVERENDESRRKRVEEGNRILMEQLKARETLIEHQKEMKRKAFEESANDHKNYLKEQKELCEKRQQIKCQFRNDLNDQINARKHIMEKQKMIEMENHRICMMESAEQEKLLQKLLKQV